MANKKNYGAGSVYYNKDRKNWTTSYTVKDINTHKDKRIRKSFPTKEEADRYLRIIQYQKNNEIFIKHNSIPLFELMRLIQNKKLENHQIGMIAYKRLDSTLKVIEKCDVVHKDINSITSEELQKYFNSITYYSTSYIRKIVELFSQAFNYAMNKGFLLCNPMFDTITPRSTRKDKVIRALDINEQQRLTEYLINSSTDNEPYKNAYLIEMYMGLRIGEAFALKKNDINLQKGIIHISRTITRDENGKRIMGDNPKTLAGIRDIPIPRNILPQIKEQMQLADCHKDNLLFVSNAGTMVDPVNANHVFKKRICQNLGIYDVTSHSLRHTFGTRCIEAGMRAVALQKLMGHSNVSVTLNVYTDVFNKYKESELEKVNNYYLNNEFFKDENNLLESTQTLLKSDNSEERNIFL